MLWFSLLRANSAPFADIIYRCRLDLQSFVLCCAVKDIEESALTTAEGTHQQAPSSRTLVLDAKARVTELASSLEVGQHGGNDRYQNSLISRLR